MLPVRDSHATSVRDDRPHLAITLRVPTIRGMAETAEKTNVLLIGAGPIGLEMAVALKVAGVDYVHVEAEQIGHTISWFPRQCRFFSSPDRIAICGVPLVTADQSKATREEYLAYLRGIVQQFDLKVRTYERVTRIDRLPASDEDRDAVRFAVSTQRSSGDRTCHAKNIVLAIGDMHRPRRLRHPELPAVPGADLPHVSHYFDEPHMYFGQRLLIVGGRNSAVEAAIRCHRAGATVAISYRKAEFSGQSIKYWLKPEIDGLTRTGEIAFYPHTSPTEITPTTVTLSRVDDASSSVPESRSVPADFVLLMIGYEMDHTLLKMAGVEVVGENQAPVLDPMTMQTGAPGVYVAGTAAAGTQINFRLFIENCHVHVVHILRSIAGMTPDHVNELALRQLEEHPLGAES
jgi:thioredoxin reductase (NADPH)